MKIKDYKQPKITINKVYTKTGDKGLTSIVGGHKFSKSDLRIGAFGEIEELNALIGMCCVESDDILKNTLFPYLQRVQHELFNLGNMLATLPENHNSEMPSINDSDIVFMEDKIDAINSNLPVLKSFILPGGSELSVNFHLARSVCRRCERLVVSLSEMHEVDFVIIKYLNRLSDLLFVLSRWANCEKKIKENIWNPNYK